MRLGKGDASADCVLREGSSQAGIGKIKARPEEGERLDAILVADVDMPFQFRADTEARHIDGGRRHAGDLRAGFIEIGDGAAFG